MKLYLFNKVIKLYFFLELPAMTHLERIIYKNVLLSIRADKTLDVFEYGSGYSTIYFSKFLEKKKIPFHLHSIDNSEEWHQKVQNMVKANKFKDKASLHLCAFPAFWEKSGWDWSILPKCGQFAPAVQAEIDYINMPLNLNKKFDFIIVDGRFRRRCLEVIPKCLKKNGIVFLHDAQKEKYHKPLSAYRYSEFIDSGKHYPFERAKYKIWLGSLDNSVICDIAERFRK